MPIDTTAPATPGGHMARLARKLADPKRQTRLNLLNRYMDGDAPLPEGGDNVREVHRLFQRRSRTNYGRLIVGSKQDRMRLLGFRTAAANDENGDAEAARVLRETGLILELADTLKNMLGVGEGYMIVGLDDRNRPVITSEDPRQLIGEHDPMRRQVLVRAVKLFHDDVAEKDFCYLYDASDPSDVRVYVASRRRRAVSAGVTFNASAYEWDDEYGGAEGSQLPAMPVVPFLNNGGIGEFEPHIDLLDRINYMVLERMNITAMQAFRQRAIEGTLPELDENGNPIDYDKLFEAGPAALWQLPEGVKIWESATTDMTPILSSVKSDVEILASITSTPMYILFSDATNQSASGADLARESTKASVEDRIDRATPSLARVMSLVFLFLGDAVRADTLGIEPVWAPVVTYGLAERGSAWAQMADMPFETKLREVMQFTPEQIARAKTERMDDLVFAPLLAAVKTPVTPDTVPVGA